MPQSGGKCTDNADRSLQALARGHIQLHAHPFLGAGTIPIQVSSIGDDHADKTRWRSNHQLTAGSISYPLSDLSMQSVAEHDQSSASFWLIRRASFGFNCDGDEFNVSKITNT
jgi:hypothetical protein